MARISAAEVGNGIVNSCCNVAFTNLDLLNVGNHSMNTMTKLNRLSVIVCLMSVWLVSQNAKVLRSEEWEGWRKISFQVEDRNAFLIAPKMVAEGNPWIWRTEFFGHEPQADKELLEHGFHVAYVDMQNLYGGPAAMNAMDAMYAHVTSEFGLSKKTVLEGFSRGGLYSLNWAIRNPSQVACIYNDAPVCDFKSWPGGKGRGKGSAGDWERCKSVYGLSSEAEAIAYAFNPVDHLKPLAEARIPLLHVCGGDDDVVPIEENSLLVQQRYQALGGDFTLIVKPNCNHHPHSLHDPTRIVNFVLEHTGHAEEATVAETPFGYDYFALRSGLERSKKTFENEKRGRVAFLGGSITAVTGWRDLVCEQLKERFPETEFDFINAGIPSLGSTPGAFRFERDVLANGEVDLLFEEAAVNDDTNGFSDLEQVRGMEGIVRQALIANPNMDIVLLHFADPGKLQEYRNGQTPVVISNHERVAEHYQIPSIDLAKEVGERIRAGEFSWEVDFKDLHPAPFGHSLYARSIERLFNDAWRDDPSPAKSQRDRLPEPLDRFSYFRGKLLGPEEVFAASAESSLQDWCLDKNWTPQDKAGTRDGFVGIPMVIGDKPNAVTKVVFEGVGFGVFVTSGPDSGRLEYRVDGGDWSSVELFTPWSSGLHLPWAKMLASELADQKHSIELRVADEADAKSVGHVVRIAYFLVNRGE